LNALLSRNDKRQWHNLDTIVQSALADVISADANFQLSQGEAWRQFNESLQTVSDNPLLKAMDFSVGFGRLENLAINEISVQLPVEVYKPSVLKRFWWGVLKWVGKPPQKNESQFRLSRDASGAANRIEIAIKVTRDEQGRWQASHDLPS